LPNQRVGTLLKNAVEQADGGRTHDLRIRLDELP
jgi:hypothetical protein